MRLLPSNFSFFIFLASLGLVLGLRVSATMAFEILDKPTTVYSEKEQSPGGKKKEPRRRGDCDFMPNAWTLNICQSNTVCYVVPEEVRLWLPKHKRSGQMNDRLVIKNLVSQTVVIKQWPASKATLAWPLSKMPLQSGTYLVGIKKGRRYLLNEIVLHQIPVNLSVTKQLAEMRQKGCTQQADMLEELVIGFDAKIFARKNF